MKTVKRIFRWVMAICLTAIFLMIFASCSYIVFYILAHRGEALAVNFFVAFFFLMLLLVLTAIFVSRIKAIMGWRFS